MTLFTRASRFKKLGLLAGVALAAIAALSFGLALRASPAQGQEALPPFPNDGVTLKEGPIPAGTIPKEEAIDILLRRSLEGDLVRNNPAKYPITAQFRRYSAPGGSYGPAAQDRPVWVVEIRNFHGKGPQELPRGAKLSDYRTGAVSIIDAETGQYLYGFGYGMPLRPAPPSQQP